MTAMLPYGATSHALNAGLFTSRAHIRHEKKQAQQLADLREGAKPAPPAHVPSAAEYQRRICSPEGRDEFRDGIAAIRAAIARAEAERNDGAVRPQKRSGLLRVASATKMAGRAVVMRGILSWPEDNKPNFKDSMRPPRRRSDQPTFRQAVSAPLRRGGPKLTKEQLLGQGSIDSRIAARRLKNATHLEDAAKEALVAAESWMQVREQMLVAKFPDVRACLDDEDSLIAAQPNFAAAQGAYAAVVMQLAHEQANLLPLEARVAALDPDGTLAPLAKQVNDLAGEFEDLEHKIRTLPDVIEALNEEIDQTRAALAGKHPTSPDFSELRKRLIDDLAEVREMEAELLASEDRIEDVSTDLVAADDRLSLLVADTAPLREAVGELTSAQNLVERLQGVQNQRFADLNAARTAAAATLAPAATDSINDRIVAHFSDIADEADVRAKLPALKAELRNVANGKDARDALRSQIDAGIAAQNALPGGADQLLLARMHARTAELDGEDQAAFSSIMRAPLPGHGTLLQPAHLASVEFANDIADATTIRDDAIALRTTVADDLAAARTVHHARATSPIASRINALSGFDPDALRANQTPAGPTVREALGGRFQTLMRRLDAQHDMPANALDSAIVGKITYDAILHALSPNGEPADPTRAIAVLDELLDPAMNMDRLVDLHRIVPGAAAAPPPDLSDDARHVLEELITLGRGPEIVQRLVSDAPQFVTRDLTEKEKSLKVYLTAGSQFSDPAIDDAHLRAAQSGARKQYAAALEVEANKANPVPNFAVSPAYQLTDEEKVAVGAVRNRLTPGHLDAVSARLQKVTAEWLPRAAARNKRRLLGSVGQGSHAGAAKLLDLSPTTGKTPFNKKVLQLATQTSTAYGIDPVKTADRIDKLALSSSKAILDFSEFAVQHTGRPLHPINAIYMEAIKVARDRAASMGIRPELCMITADQLADALAALPAPPAMAGAFHNPFDEDDELDMALANPLRGENLFAAKNLALETTSHLRDDDPLRLAATRCAAEVQKFEQLLDLTPAAELNTEEDVYRFMAAKIQQFELRGKLRTSSGGGFGGNIKPITFAVKLSDKALQAVNAIFGGVSIAPRAKLEGNATTAALFEFEMSTVGFTVTIGRERRKSGAIGAGVGATVSAPLSILKAGASADKTWSGENVEIEGVKFMIPRSVPKEYTDDEMRDEAAAMLSHIFGMHLNPDGTVAHNDDEPDVNGVPGRVAGMLRDCPHLTINPINLSTDDIRRQETALSASFKPGIGASGSTPGGLGAVSVGVATSVTTSRKVNISEDAGIHGVSRSNVAGGGQITLTGGAGGQVTQPLGNGFSVLPGAAYSGTRQVKLTGRDAKYRQVDTYNKNDPTNTRRDVEHSGPDTLAASVRANREAWVQLGMVELFKRKEYQEYADAPVAEKRRVVEANLDALLAELDARDKSEDGHKVLRNVFAESYRLTDAVSGELNGLRDMQMQCERRTESLKAHLRELRADQRPMVQKRAEMDSLKAARNEARAEAERLAAAQAALLSDDASWMPWKITASERTYENQQAGLDFFLRFGITNTADGQRPIKSWPV